MFFFFLLSWEVPEFVSVRVRDYTIVSFFYQILTFLFFKVLRYVVYILNAAKEVLHEARSGIYLISGVRRKCSWEGFIQ